jgi:hypothetical protein
MRSHEPGARRKALGSPRARTFCAGVGMESIPGRGKSARKSFQNILPDNKTP